MRKADRRALRQYIRTVADRMDLRDWEFRVLREPAHDDNTASVKPIYGQRVALLKFASYFRGLNPEEVRNAVVHELVHCHLATTQQMIQDDLSGLLSEPVAETFSRAYRRANEYAVDALACVIAKNMPLIDWPP